MSVNDVHLLMANVLRRDIAPLLPDGQALARLQACERILFALSDSEHGEAPEEHTLGSEIEALRKTNTAFRIRETSPAAQPETAQVFDQALLREILCAEFPGYPQLEITDLVMLPGGRAKQTACFTLGGTASPGRLVIRRDAMSGPAATHDRSVAQEFPVLAMLHATGRAVPRPIFAGAWPGAPGVSFIVMETVSGKAASSPFAAPANAQVALGLAEQLGRLHSLDVALFPQTAQRGGAQNVHDELLASLRDMAAKSWDRLPLIVDAALRQLEATSHRVERRTAIVHGDAGFHNVMANDRLVALIDWELAHVGHPAEDLGYVRASAERVVPWSDFMHRYRSAGGPDISDSTITFYSIAENLRMALRTRKVGLALAAGAIDDIALADVGTSFPTRYLAQLSEYLDVS